MENILIAGCGDLGGDLGRRLAATGHSVWGLRRQAERITPPIRPIAGDLTAADSLSGLPSVPLDRLYYLATPGAYQDEAYRQAYVIGLQNLLAALPHAPRRLVLVSSTSVYGQLDGEWVDENSPTAPRSFAGRRLLQAEDLAGQCPGAVVVRFGGIYGPGRQRMLDKVRRGEPCVAAPPYYTNRIHREDCIGVLAHLGRADVPPGLYLAVDDEPCTQCELMDWLAQRMQLPRPERRSDPAGGVRGSNKRCRNDRLKATGYRLLYPSYREGYDALLRAT